jgi:myo-inositol 2-dehydrogenase/D-chiro-inositol 1-dehydrogenase
MSLINVGLIGAGRIGRVHAEHLAYRIPEARIIAVSDIDTKAAKKLAGDFQIPAVFEDHRRIMEDKDIEAIVICSSTNTHAQMIEEAAANGKHIFCEKPIDHDLAKIDRVLDAVKKAKVKLQVGFNRRFDPNFRRVREIVASGGIGTPQILRITSRDPAPPTIAYVKVSGGMFLDMTIHDFDMARYQIGSEVYEIYVAAGTMIDPEIGKAGDVDTAIILLRFENGVIGTIDNSRKAVYGYDQRLEVFGSGGCVTADNNFPNTTFISDAKRVHRDLPLNFFMQRYTESYIAEMTEFVECVLQDKAPQVTGMDGRIPVVMGYAAKKSFQENRPVKLNEVDLQRLPPHP